MDKGEKGYKGVARPQAKYINLNLGCLSVQQPSKKGKGWRGSFKLLH